MMLDAMERCTGLAMPLTSYVPRELGGSATGATFAGATGFVGAGVKTGFAMVETGGIRCGGWFAVVMLVLSAGRAAGRIGGGAE